MKKLYLRPKSYFFLILSVILLFITFINSCKKDEKQTQENQVSKISLAKDWYQKTYPVIDSKSTLKTQGSGSSINNDFSQFLKPDWEKAATYNRLSSDVIEMPLDSAAKLALIDKNVNVQSFDFNKSYSKSSFLILNDGTNYSAYIMTIVTDSSYLKNDFSKLSNNTYRKHDKDFSGYLLYYTPNGVFVSGWHYLNGKINKTLSAVAASSSTNIKTEGLGSSKLKTLENGCSIQTFTIYTYGYINGYLSTIFIDIYYFSVCDEMGHQPEDPNGGYPPPGGPGTPTITIRDTIKIGHVCDNLTPEQTQTIVTNVNNFTTANCATKFLYNNLKNTISSFCIGGGNNAGYNPTTKEIDFSSDYTAGDSETLEHEMFHAFQNQTYGNVFLSYGNRPNSPISLGNIDVEFEQSVYYDIVHGTRNVTFHTNDDSIKTAYDNWIKQLTNNGTSYPKLNPQTDINQYNNFISQYQSFLSQYQQFGPYGGPIANFTPNALINMFNSVNPNNC